VSTTDGKPPFTTSGGQSRGDNPLHGMDERADRPIVAELRERMEEDARRNGGTLSREAAIAWQGYLAGLIEWDVLSIAEHERLCGVLPPVEDSPVTHILPGWEDES
jgi:hypothetical protein